MASTINTDIMSGANHFAQNERANLCTVDYQTQAATAQTPEGGSPGTDTSSDSADSGPDINPSQLQAPQPDQRLIAKQREAVIAKSATQQLDLHELDIFLRQEKHQATETGTGSRGGVEGHYCEFEGCDHAHVMIPRHDRALHHVANHFNLKPHKCSKWSAFFRSE
jgi:hypothetical protein